MLGNCMSVTYTHNLTMKFCAQDDTVKFLHWLVDG